MACGERGDRFETLLGSCVAVVLTDPRRTIGVMCHIVHAGAPVAGAPRTAAYADVAFETMFQLLHGRGITPRLCEAYVYGGGNMFPGLIRDAHVGASNADRALETLDRAGIRVLLHDVGGTTYRRLSWTVGSAAPCMTAIDIAAQTEDAR